MRKLIFTFIPFILAGILILTAAADIYQAVRPPVLQEPAWDTPQTRELVIRACFDCHSSETHWPWFTKLPFSSWLAVFDTARGRSHLNFSEWGLHTGEEGHDEEHVHGHEEAEAIDSGEMPPRSYLLLHPEAVLTDGEKQQLIDGLIKSLTLP
jgi:hypothetical protein